MKQISLIIILFFILAQSQTTNYIGMSKEDIIKNMNHNNPTFSFDEGVVNESYKYLKFFDKHNEETMLFFLSDDNFCTYLKLISDYSNLKIRIDDLNKKYKSAGEFKWVFIERGEVYFVELKKEQWYFTIITKKKN